MLKIKKANEMNAITELQKLNRNFLLNSDVIRKMPIKTEQDLKLKVAEVVVRVALCVYKSAMKKYSAELEMNKQLAA
ncbi:MAG: hypothetical protein WC976_06115 [Caldisericia bacterium]